MCCSRRLWIVSAGSLCAALSAIALMFSAAALAAEKDAKNVITATPAERIQQTAPTRKNPVATLSLTQRPGQPIAKNVLPGRIFALQAKPALFTHDFSTALDVSDTSSEGFGELTPALQNAGVARRTSAGTEICSWDNGPPLADFGAAASQYDPLIPFSGEAADDFVLVDEGSNPCLITEVVTWVTFFNIAAGSSNPQTQWTGVQVTIYEDLDQPKQPAGARNDDGSFTGGVVHTQFVDIADVTTAAFPDFADSWEVHIPVAILLEKNRKYWWVMQPEMSANDFGQTGIMLSQFNSDNPAQQIFPLAGLPDWTPIQGNGGLTDLAFQLIGEKSASVCGDGSADSGEECDGADDSNCLVQGDCQPNCTCIGRGACCGIDGQTGVCNELRTEQECSALAGTYFGDGSVCDDCPTHICGDEVCTLPENPCLCPQDCPGDCICTRDNGPPLADFGAIASQYAPDVPFSAEAADDFFLADEGSNPCLITEVVTWVTFFNIAAGSSNPQTQWTGVQVTIYEDLDQPKQPAGSRADDGSFTGGVVHTQFVDIADVTTAVFPDFADSWEVHIPVAILLEKNRKYWWVMQPEMNANDFGQTGIMLSQFNSDHPAQQIFPLAGLLDWTVISGSEGLTDLAFQLIGEKSNAVCGNGSTEPGEQCDGADDSNCAVPGDCQSDCTCIVRGACCNSGDGCSENLTEADCIGLGGTFFGQATACDACPHPACFGATTQCREEQPAGTVGCADLDCCAAICESDPNCCEVQWDFLCAGTAETSGICPPANNDCANRVDIFDGDTGFDTIAATTDGPDLFGFCDLGGFGDEIVHNDVWYNYQATCTGQLLITTCEELGGFADYDTRLAVYEGCGCPADPATVVGCNDDDLVNQCGLAGGFFHSTLRVFVEQGTCYKFQVGGFDENTAGVGLLHIACNPACAFECPAGSGSENPGQACPVDGDIGVDDPNGGCNSVPPQFEPIECGQTICAETATYIDGESGDPARDTDWFEFTLSASATVTVTASAERSLLFGVLDTGNGTCSNAAFIANNLTSGNCDEQSASADLDAGTYALVVALPAFVGEPCDDRSDYWIRLDTDPADACETSPCNAACPQDTDFSGDVRVPDLIALLGCWGFLPGLDPICVCLDIDGSGDIRVPDLIALLGEWGLCP